MTCVQCGKRIRKDAGNCPYCGIPIEPEDKKSTTDKAKAAVTTVDDAVTEPAASAVVEASAQAESTPQPAANVCPVCGNEAAAGMSFCNQCGTSLTAAAPAPVVASPTSAPNEPPTPVATPAPAPSEPVVPVATPTPPASACPRCGSAAEPGAAFCRQCGASLTQQTAPVAAAAAAAPPAVEHAPTAAPPMAAAVPSAPQARAPRRKKTVGIIVAAALVLAAAALLFFFVLPNSRYNKAVDLLAGGQYAEAQSAFTALGDFRDAPDRAMECQNYLDYNAANDLMQQEKYSEAESAFRALGNFNDARRKADECHSAQAYNMGAAAFDQHDYLSALEFFESAGAYKDAAQRAALCQDYVDYTIATECYNNGQYYEAYVLFNDLADFEDSAAMSEKCIQPLPSTGTMYSNGGVAGSGSQFRYRNNSVFRYIKIYTEDGTLARTGFVNPDDFLTFYLPAGTYRINIASYSGGDVPYWFGETDMFGPNAYYEKMLDNDNVTETFEIPYNMYLEITPGAGTADDSVYTRDTERDAF